MSTLMEDDLKRWTTKRKSALVMGIIQSKTTAAEASRSYRRPHQALGRESPKPTYVNFKLAA